MTDGKYLYCIIREKNQKEFNVLGIEGGKVYTISEGELSVVVSDAEIKEYPISRENTLTHQKVIEEVMKEYDVLPISFGTVAKSEKEIKEKILKSRTSELSSTFKKIKGKVELNLKAIWLDLPSIFQEIIKEDQEIQITKKEATKVSGIGRTNLAMEVGKMVASALEEKKEREAREILKPLKKIAEDFKENKVQLDQVIFNTAFLVSKEKEKEFDKEVSALSEKYDGRIKFFYVGPLPPYNFIELVLKI
ncbi:GvpL/GvpF family gas vesicle protein [Candidatus Roizmanbacteria bacterium]|nr:GvpL/GvpF family gas vesicle protein [Candidatus Roizmanbacteria bacterium]